MATFQEAMKVDRILTKFQLWKKENVQLFVKSKNISNCNIKYAQLSRYLMKLTIACIAYFCSKDLKSYTEDQMIL